MTANCCWLTPKLKERMSVSLFNAVPAGAIEVLTDENGAPHFKRADLGRFLGIVVVARNNNNIATKSRSELSRSGYAGNVTRSGMYGGGENPHDAFVDLEAALGIVVRSRKPKAVELTKWLTRKGVEKVVEEHQKAIEEKQREIDEKDMQIALLDDDLVLEQEHARQLEYNNTGLQGEIRAKDQEIARRETELAELRERYVDHCRDSNKDNLVVITRKHTCECGDKHFEYPYYISRIQRRAISTKRRWLLDQFPDSEEIVIIDNPNSVHAFNRLEEEGHVERYKCHFKLVDLSREDLYDMGVPTIEE